MSVEQDKFEPKYLVNEYSRIVNKQWTKNNVQYIIKKTGHLENFGDRI